MKKVNYHPSLFTLTRTIGLLEESQEEERGRERRKREGEREKGREGGSEGMRVREGETRIARRMHKDR